MGAVTMKITSSTSMTSTRGVMLIWAMLSSSCSSKAMGQPSKGHQMRCACRMREKVASRDIEKLGRKVFHVRSQQPYLASKVIICDHCRNGGCQPDRGGNQGFGDPWRHRLKARRLDRA